jgi:hypothetical protein
MPKVSFRMASASRESVFGVQTSTVRNLSVRPHREPVDHRAKRVLRTGGNRFRRAESVGTRVPRRLRKRIVSRDGPGDPQGRPSADRNSPDGGSVSGTGCRRSSVRKSACKDSTVINEQATVVAVSRDGDHWFSKPQTHEILLLAGLGVQGDAHSETTVQHRSRVAADPNRPTFDRCTSSTPNCSLSLMPRASPSNLVSSARTSPPRIWTCSHYPAARNCALGPKRSLRSPGFATRALRSTLSSHFCSTRFLGATATAR